MTPALSVIIPTPDGEDLDRCIESILQQELIDRDEVIIVGDTQTNSLERVQAQVCRLGPPFHYRAHAAGYHAWGHPQYNAGLRTARGDYLVFNEDDDVFTPDAFARIRAALAELQEPRPRLFRFISQSRRLLWHEPKLEEDNVSGHQFVTPNLPGLVGEWTDRYRGDFDFIIATLRLWPPNTVVWRPDIIAVARPDA